MTRYSLIVLAVAVGTLSHPAVAAPPPPAAKSAPTAKPVVSGASSTSSKSGSTSNTSAKPEPSAKATTQAAPDTNTTLKGDREGTVFRSLTVEGEDRIRIEFERPPIVLELDPEKAPGLEWGSARDVLDRSVPNFGAPYVAQSAKEQSPFVGRPWLGEFTPDAVARFKPQVEGVERWRLLVANARGEAIKTFQGRGDPPKEIVWDGRSDKGDPATPGLRYSYVFEAFDRAGNKRNFVGEGFQLNAYRIDTPTGPVLVCAGSTLAAPSTATGAVSALAPAPAMTEVATWLNQSSEPTRPIRVEVTARSADAGNAIVASIMRQLPPLVPGGSGRVQCAVQVQPDAPESGSVRFSAAR